MQPTLRLARSGVRPARCVRFLLALTFSLQPGSPSAAEETQPEEIRYETPGQFPTLDPDYRQTDHEVVLITDNELRPRAAALREGQLVAWISYSKAASTIVFERDIAQSMICHSLVNFHLDESGLRSAEIHTGEFASFCELKPGRYRYKVLRRDPKAAGAGGAARRLEGEIIVGKTD